MAQVFNYKPHDGVKHHAVGGYRLLLRDKSEDMGFLHVGKFSSPNLAQNVERFTVYDASSGKRLKLGNLNIGTEIKFDIVADEMLLLNLRRFFLAGVHTDVAANVAATANAETFKAGKSGIHHGIRYGRQTSVQRTALAVYNVTDAALLVAGTDYDLISIFGWSYVRMKVDTHAGDTLRVGTGATAVTAYNHDQLASKQFAPMTKLAFDLEGIIQFPAGNGPAMQWRVPSMDIAPNGNLDWNAQENSKAPLTMEILDDSANNPTAPFGLIDLVGYDDAGAALI